MRKLILAPFAMLLVCGLAQAQTSTSFTLESYSLSPASAQSMELSSQSFAMQVSAVDTTAVAGDPSSNSYSAVTGLDAAYPSPGEVAAACGVSGNSCLRFTDRQTLAWPPEPAAGVYNLYRDSTSPGFGQCLDPDLTAPGAIDSAIPGLGEAFFYLATVKNRLGEEGIKGFQSDTNQRMGETCP